jgi:hypothetical protein
MRADLQRLKRDTESGRTAVALSETAVQPAWSRWVALAGAVVLVLGLAVGGFWWLNGRKAHALSATDTIVLADFTNTTCAPQKVDATSRSNFFEPIFMVQPAENISRSYPAIGWQLMPVDSRARLRSIARIRDSGSQARMGSPLIVVGNPLPHDRPQMLLAFGACTGVRRNEGMGSSSLNADVNALERLQIVRGRNSSYFGSK